ncbi:MAG: SusC/RagA family TonB-linked outer membrane protein, partial [Saprospiraceae bacterium]|nr:SusC/RagA family TonB-linked outer membrane protein [Saprospiraceae bacterium]
DGTFLLEIAGDEAILNLTYLGYRSETVIVNQDNTIVNLQLREDIANLDEVVVTGLASTVKRSNLANSVGFIDGKTLTGTTVQSTMDGALYGKFKGANISANSGAPGGGISIKLRGVTSLTASSQPLFIVDGVYVDNSAIKAGFDIVTKSQAGGSTNVQDDPSNRIADLDPEDIETIEVLKGASAAAIYGSRAGAGVVIITTKRGNSGKTQVRLSQSIGTNFLIRKMGQRSWDAAKVESFFGADQVPVFQATGSLFDYENELYNNPGLMSTSRISISGGNDKTKFFAGGTYKDDAGIVQNTGYEKSSIRLNLDHKVADWIDVGISSNYISSSADRGYFNNDNSGTTLGVSFVGTPSWIDLHSDVDGNFPNNPVASANFLQTATQVTNNENVNRFIMGTNVRARIFYNARNSLNFILRGGIDYYTFGTTAIFPRTLQFQKDGNGTNGASIQGRTTNSNKTYSAFLVHTYSGERGIGFRTQVGLTAADFDQNTIRNSATFLIGTQSNLDQAGSIQIQQNIIDQKDRGFFIQEEFNLQDKILMTAGVRGDKSSNNGDANNLNYYPKGSVAVNLHEFQFWNSSAIDLFKVRVAYGQSGNFPRFGAIFTPLIPTNFAGTTGSVIGSTRGNRALGPEKQTEIEAGFDLGIFNNKVLLDFTVYRKNIDDLVLDVDVPTSSGFSRKWTNVGQINNWGIEAGISAFVLRKENLAWETIANFWLNRATVERLDVPAYNTGAFGATLGTYRIQRGESPTQVGGIGTTGDDDGDGFIKYGDAEPDFQLSWLNYVTYKQFQLSFLFHWKEGGENVNLTTLLSDLFGTSPDFDDKDLDPSGTMSNGDFRLNALGVTAAPWIEDAGYLRLREVGLFYNIPRAKLSEIFDLRLGVTGRNLWLKSNYNSYDPEVSNFGSNAISSAVEVTPFPASRSIHFNVTATF